METPSIVAKNIRAASPRVDSPTKVKASAGTFSSDDVPRRRPRSVAEAVSRTAPLRSHESLEPVRRLKTRPSDVFIAAYPRCGTTWLQQIVHSLRSNGSTDAGEISLTIPFMERAFILGMDLNDPQTHTPRAFKTHLGPDLVPTGGLYLVSIRDPAEALVSLYYFLKGHTFESGSIDIHTFAREGFIAGRKYWRSLTAWWKRRHEPGVLILSFEMLKGNLPDCVRAIARHIGISLDSGLLDLVTEQASFTYMARHRRRFEDRSVVAAVDRLCGFPPTPPMPKIRRGSSGGAVAELSDEITDELDRVWREEIEPRCGHASYHALHHELAEIRKTNTIVDALPGSKQSRSS